MKRKRLTVLQEFGLLERHKYICHICGEPIDAISQRWEWQVEHIIPLAMGGKDEISNMAPAHVSCHKGKTKTDVKAVAKAKRIQAKHMGARRKGSIPSRKFGAGKSNVKQLRDL